MQIKHPSPQALHTFVEIGLKPVYLYSHFQALLEGCLILGRKTTTTWKTTTALATSVDPREAKSVVFPYFEVLVVYSSTVYVPSLIFASPQPQHTKYPFWCV